MSKEDEKISRRLEAESKIVKNLISIGCPHVSPVSRDMLHHLLGPDSDRREKIIYWITNSPASSSYLVRRILNQNPEFLYGAMDPESQLQIWLLLSQVLRDWKFGKEEEAKILEAKSFLQTIAKEGCAKWTSENSGAAKGLIPDSVVPGNAGHGKASKSTQSQGCDTPNRTSDHSQMEELLLKAWSDISEELKEVKSKLESQGGEDDDQQVVAERSALMEAAETVEKTIEKFRNIYLSDMKPRVERIPTVDPDKEMEQSVSALKADLDAVHSSVERDRALQEAMTEVDLLAKKMSELIRDSVV